MIGAAVVALKLRSSKLDADHVSLLRVELLELLDKTKHDPWIANEDDPASPGSSEKPKEVQPP